MTTSIYKYSESFIDNFPDSLKNLPINQNKLKIFRAFDELDKKFRPILKQIAERNDLPDELKPVIKLLKATNAMVEGVEKDINPRADGSRIVMQLGWDNDIHNIALFCAYLTFECASSLIPKNALNSLKEMLPDSEDLKSIISSFNETQSIFRKSWPYEEANKSVSKLIKKAEGKEYTQGYFEFQVREVFEALGITFADVDHDDEFLAEDFDYMDDNSSPSPLPTSCNPTEVYNKLRKLIDPVSDKINELAEEAINNVKKRGTTDAPLA